MGAGSGYFYYLNVKTDSEDLSDSKIDKAKPIICEPAPKSLHKWGDDSNMSRHYSSSAKNGKSLFHLSDEFLTEELLRSAERDTAERVRAAGKLGRRLLNHENFWRSRSTDSTTPRFRRSQCP